MTARKRPRVPTDYNPFGLPLDFWALRAEYIREQFQFKPDRMEVRRWLNGEYATLKLLYVVMGIKVVMAADQPIKRESMFDPPTPLPEGESPYIRQPWWKRKYGGQPTRYKYTRPKVKRKPVEFIQFPDIE